MRGDIPKRTIAKIYKIEIRIDSYQKIGGKSIGAIRIKL